MSASRAKSNRTETPAKELTKKERRAQQELEEQRKNKRVTRIAILVVVIVVIVALVLAVLTDSIPFFSGKIKESAAAYTVGDVTFTAADYNYYYYSIANSYVENYSSYFEMLGIDTSTTNFFNESFNAEMTWGQYFEQEAENTMNEIGYKASAARAAGYTLSEAANQETDDYFSYLSNYGSSLGLDLDTYYQNMYGPGVTEAVYRRNVDLAKLAEEYGNVMTQSFVDSYTDADYENYYSQNAVDIDVADYAYFFMSGIVQADTDETEEEAMQDALNDSNAFVERLNAGEAFSDLAYEYCLEISKSRYENPEEAYMYEYTYARTNAAFRDWVFDESRQPGDVEIFEGDPSQSFTGYFIVQYLDKYRCDYNTVTYRNILTSVTVDDYETYTASVEGQEDALGYDDYVLAQWDEGHAKVDDLIAQWQANGGDEDAFAELATTQSFDTTTYADGGLNYQKGLHDMDAELSAWLFDPARKPGDTEVFQTDDGLQLIYFSGPDQVRWKIQVSDILSALDYNNWYAGLQEQYGEPQKHSFGMMYTRK